jgi:membrane-bound serine protease (ClpP class)
MVTEARSFDSSEAKKLGLIDLTAADLGELLTKLNGRVVTTAGGQRRIETAGKAISFHKPGLREKILSVLADPNLAYILLMVGMMGLYFELANPGAILPGVVGGISLILAFFAMSTLPISYAGLALLGLGVAMFVAEILVVSKGLLSLGGAISLVLGSIMLFESDDEMMKVSLGVLLPTAAGVVLFFGAVTYLAVRAQVGKSSTGREGMVGLRGVAVAPNKIRVMGELWTVASDSPLTPGQAVEVVGMDGLTLRVKQTETDAQPGQGPGASGP